MLSLIYILYLLIAVAFFIATFREGQKANGPWNGKRVLGLALSLVWPVLIVAAIISVIYRRERG